MREFVSTNWTKVKAGDYIRVTRKGYGIREGRLNEYRYSESGGWIWTDDNDNPLLDAWWVVEGTIEKRK